MMRSGGDAMENSEYVDLPVTFSFRYIQPRCRTYNTRTVVISHPFEIKVADPAQVELAALATYERRIDQGDGTTATEMAETPYYLVEGQLLRPLMIDPETLQPTDDPRGRVVPEMMRGITNDLIAKVMEKSGYIYDAFCPEGLNPQKPRKEYAVAFETAEAEARLIDEGQTARYRDDAVRKRQEFMDRCRVINGVVCIPSAGPVYIITKAQADKTVAAVYRGGVLIEPPPPAEPDYAYTDPKRKKEKPPRPYSPLNPVGVQREVSRRANALLRDGVPQGVDGGINGDIAIYCPDVFRNDDLAVTVRQQLKEVNSKFSMVASGCSPDLLMAMAEVRRLERAGFDDDRTVEDVIGALKTVHGVWQSEKQGFSHYPQEIATAIARIENMLEGHRASELAFDPDVNVLRQIEF
jgi:hypothetical protein